MSKQQLIDSLNEDLAGELQAVIMYTVYSARVTGPYRPQLVEFLQAEIADEQGHAQFLANHIVNLGGKPTTEPHPVPEADTVEDMLKNVMAAEKQAIADYSERAKQAEEAGEKGLAINLEDIIADETDHYHETRKLLENWR